MVSPGIQRDEIEKYATDKGWTIVGWFEDLDISGRTDERPGLQAMLRDATGGAADVVVFYRIDRLSREERDFHAILATLQRAGVHCDSVGNPNDGSPESGLIWSISAALAKYESVRLGGRIRDSHKRLARLGRWGGGPVPFGWRRVRDEDGPRLDVDEEEARWRRWIHQRYWDGASTHEIARDLNVRSGVRPRSGGWWTNGIVRAMLVAPIQIGARDAEGELVTGGNIEPLLPEADYQRTLALVPARSRRRGKRTAVVCETALFRCGTCGGPMHMQYVRGKPIYYCSSRNRGACELGVAINVDRACDTVEAAVLARVRRMRPGRAHKRPAVTAKAREAGATLSRAREAVARLSLMFAAGEMTEREFMDARRLARERVERAEEDLRAIERAAEAEAGREALEALWADLGGLSEETWRSLSVAVRRQIVGMLVAHVVVSPGRLPAVERCAITWR